MLFRHCRFGLSQLSECLCWKAVVLDARRQSGLRRGVIVLVYRPSNSSKGRRLLLAVRVGGPRAPLKCWVETFDVFGCLGALLEKSLCRANFYMISIGYADFFTAVARRGRGLGVYQGNSRQTYGRAQVAPLHRQKPSLIIERLTPSNF